MEENKPAPPCEIGEPPGYKRLWFLTVFLACIGIINFGMLSYTHYRVHADPNYTSFCAISKDINCDTVANSPYSVAAGLPVSVWGLAGFLLVLALLLQCYRLNDLTRHLWSSLFLLGSAFTIASLYFAYISTFLIKSFCLLCMGAYAVNFGLLFISWIARRRLHLKPLVSSTLAPWRYPTGRRTLFAITALALPTLLLPASGFVPNYWEASTGPKGSGVQWGVTDEGDPWIGADKPALEIIEYADYQCLQCRKVHFHLRRLIENNPGKLRLIHRHFPMDHKVNPLVTEPFHVGSGALALLAIYASSVNRFWEMNDTLYEVAGTEHTVDIESIASKAGLDKNGLFDAVTHPDRVEKLSRDIRSGLKLGVAGTPAYYINGELFFGTIPREIIERFLH